MKTKKKYYSALFIPLLIIMIISFFNMQNAKLIKSTYELHLLKQMLWYLLGFLLIIIVQKLNLKVLFKYFTGFSFSFRSHYQWGEGLV